MHGALDTCDVYNELCTREVHTKLPSLKKKTGNHVENIDIDVTITLKAVDLLSFFQVDFYSDR
jgi:hypothetical protein